MERRRHTLVGPLKSEAEKRELPSPSGSHTPTGPRHPFYHGETEVLRRGRDSPKVTARAGLNPAASQGHSHPTPAEISDVT